MPKNFSKERPYYLINGELPSNYLQEYTLTEYKPSLEEWTHQSLSSWDSYDNFMGTAPYKQFVVYARNRDSDLLTESNWYEIIKRLSELGIEYKQEHEIVRFGHWLCGWIEQILIPQGSLKYNLDYIQYIQAIEQIHEELTMHPVLNEEDFSERQSNQYIGNLESEVKDFIYSNSNEIDFTNSEYFEDEDMTQRKEKLITDINEHITNELFHGAGYSSENYPEDEDVPSALTALGIYRNLTVLKHQAEESINLRGHSLANWEDIPTDYWKKENIKDMFEELPFIPSDQSDVKYSNSYCLICNLEVQITLKPQPNEISIGGEAVAINCKNTFK